MFGLLKILQNAVINWYEMWIQQTVWWSLKDEFHPESKPADRAIDVTQSLQLTQLFPTSPQLPNQSRGIIKLDNAVQLKYWRKGK